MYLIVGLGNPEEKYAKTFHNMGFLAAGDAAEALHVKFKKRECEASVAEGYLSGEKVIIARPLTYMNASGRAVKQLVAKYKVSPKELIVIYDDYDLPKGHVRIRPSGSAGTHNGMRSVIGELGRQDFPRLRVGVGHKPEDWELVDWVLSHYQSAEERQTQFDAFLRAAEVVLDYMKNGLDSAMRMANAPAAR